MQVGMHVSIAGSIDRAVDNALTLGCNAFQIFTRNPRGWKTKPLSNEVITNFREKLSVSKIDRFATVAHMPYLPNLSSPEEDPFSKSVNSLVDELKRCSKLGIPYLVAHLGSHKGAGDQKGIERLVTSFTNAAKETPSDVIILLENTAGQKNSVGSDFDQLSSILFQLKPAKRFGICLDTCHAFAAGYDLRTEKKAQSTIEQFDKSIGIENIKIVHLNDSKGELGCNIDRHEHIGLGKIGETGLSYIVKFANSKKIPVILETPIDDRRDDFGNIKKVKELAEL
ncbi:MAG TPA: deoxyribonuclease IV [Nitrosopumilaceae archaeon]|nr:deoxyribonuclease IV [Nitrosopumilaceae archaeon]